VRDAVKLARARIEQNGGDARPAELSRMASQRDDWAKNLLPDDASLSCNDAIKLLEAARRCEIKRVTGALCEAHGGISEGELRRRYNDDRKRFEAEANRPTGEMVGGFPRTQGGPLLAEYDAFIESKADRQTLGVLRNALGLLSVAQVIANSKPAPHAAPMLFEQGAAHAIADTIAGYLASLNLVRGADEKAQRASAYAALRKLFDEGETEGHSFRDRCRYAFYAGFEIWDPNTQEHVDKLFAELREANRSKITPLSELEPEDDPNDPRAWMKPFTSPSRRMEPGLRVTREDGGTEFISADRLQPAPPPENS
jgi:hypothetical protein